MIQASPNMGESGPSLDRTDRTARLSYSTSRNQIYPMAKRIPEASVDEVLARTDLRSTIEPYVKLQRRGGRYWGLCPFHKEKTPSFSVSPEDGLFYCFGCSAGGSAIQFLMRMEGWTFVETIRELANRCGVKLPQATVDEDSGSRRSEQKTYFKIMEDACRFFESQLHASRGRNAMDYLDSRGVDVETVKAFRLGYAPDDWSGLLGALKRNNIDERSVEGAGLALARKSSGYYDRFRDRVMFPVVDRMGRVVGFSGRALGAVEKQKYINSPELPFFKKGEHLYGIHAAKDQLRHEREAVLVEGNFDVVTLHAAGFRTTLAPLGTALTVDQVTLLRRMSDSVVLVFDGDSAGQRAMLRCLGPCYRAELSVRAALLPEDQDPDSFVRSEGAESFRQLLARARPLAEVALDGVIVPSVGGTPEKRVKAAQAAGEILDELPAGPVRRGYADDVIRRLELTPAEMAVSKRKRRADGPADEAPGAPQRLPNQERLIVQLLVDEPRLANMLRREEGFSEMVRLELQPFVAKLADITESSGPKVRFERLVETLEGTIRGPILEAIAAPREYDPRDKEAMRKTLWQLQMTRVRQIKRQIAEELRTAEREEDQSRFDELIESDRCLTLELRELQRQQMHG